MAELENYAELKFTNAVLIDIFSRYASNSEMAEFVADDGSIDMKFKMINGVMETPKCCEQVVSLMYALFECNPQSTIGRIYAAHKVDILRETVYRLAMLLDGFSDIRLTIHSTAQDKNDPTQKISTHTEFTLAKSRSTETKVES